VRPVAPFLPEQYVILALIFVLGLVLGMFLFSGGKWKRRYKEESRLRAEEVKRREALEADRKHWEARTIAERARDDTPPPAR
jgi:hypothetical protein